MPSRIFVAALVVLALAAGIYYFYSTIHSANAPTDSWDQLVAHHQSQLIGEVQQTIYECEEGKSFLIRSEFAPHGGGSMEVFLRDATKMLLTHTGLGSDERYENPEGSFVFRVSWIEDRSIASIQEGSTTSYMNCIAKE